MHDISIEYESLECGFSQHMIPANKCVICFEQTSQYGCIQCSECALCKMCLFNIYYKMLKPAKCCPVCRKGKQWCRSLETNKPVKFKPMTRAQQHAYMQEHILVQDTQDTQSGQEDMQSGQEDMQDMQSRQQDTTLPHRVVVQRHHCCQCCHAVSHVGIFITIWIAFFLIYSFYEQQ